MTIRTLLASCAILFAGTGLAQEPAKKVIEWGWDEPDTKFIRENIGTMEQQPFDEYGAKIRQRGREWMAEVNRHFPDITVLLTFGYAEALQQAREPHENGDSSQVVRLIFDTDMMGDVDDVGTAAVLHALADQGEVKILAMGLSGKNPWSPLCLDALNTYFRRPDIPIGVVKGSAFDKRSKYAETIAKEFPHTLKSAEDAPDAALLYRKILARQPDRSVVMVTVGQVTNFQNLLKTGPDEHSNLGGVELAKQKVKAWVCMGGKIPEGREANLIHDGPAAAYAIANWPTPIIFSGWEIGQEIMTGAGLQQAPERTPVRRAYELYNGLNNRQSWDQTAVLYAVRGLEGELADYWDMATEGYLYVNQDGSNEWRTSPDKDHAYLVRKMDPKKIADAIEELMLRKPGLRK